MTRGCHLPHLRLLYHIFDKSGCRSACAYSLLNDLFSPVHIEEEAGCNPGHVCGVRLAALELRLEYMGTPVLLARVSRLAAALRDEWLARARRPPHHPHTPTSRYSGEQGLAACPAWPPNRQQHLAPLDSSTVHLSAILFIVNWVMSNIGTIRVWLLLWRSSSVILSVLSAIQRDTRRNSYYVQFKSNFHSTGLR